MTNDGIRALVFAVRERLFSVSGIIASVGTAALIIGFFLDSPVGRIIAVVVALCMFFVIVLLNDRGRSMIVNKIFRKHIKEDVYNHPRTPMKTLMFDDYQARRFKICRKGIGR
jgi:hypothetical protein